VGVRDGELRLFPPEGVEKADALRRGEDEVVAGDRVELLLLRSPLPGLGVDALDRDRALLGVAAQALRALGVKATDEFAELALLDHAFELERRRAPAGPDARRLAASGVVVVEGRRD
jgi:hypothetical protein